MTRAFHNLTSHYNIYFNARESYRKGIAKATKQVQDDFSRTLPVFPLDNTEKPLVSASDMDRVIQKVSKLISNHSITVKPEMKNRELSPREEAFYNQTNFNKWVDDSYLLMGMAQYRKNDFQTALQTFIYIKNNFHDPEINVYSRIWMARTLEAMGKAQEALKILNSLAEEEEKVSRKVRSFYSAALADHYLRNNKPENAKPWLAAASENSKLRRQRVRYHYILGQISLSNGDYLTAAEQFRKVLRMRPDYDFTFNSRINLAEAAGSAGVNVRQVKKDLKKLLRDRKNRDFADQIYYAFGRIALSEGDEAQAIEYFKKSAVSSVNNLSQKATSYLAIADLTFKNNNYIESQQYYDSAVQVLPANYPDFELIRSKSSNLNNLARYLTDVELQDSLQYLAGLTNTERIAVIDKIIEKVREEEKKARESEVVQNYTPGMQMQNQIRFQEELQRGGKWYFYNPSALGFGRNEFKRKWGTRRLEDNWRRKNKMTVNFEIAGDETVTDSVQVISAPSGDRTSRSYYLKQIPLTDSMMTISNKHLMEGLFESALIFKNDFHDLNRAETNLLTLLDRFPGSDNPYRLPAYYTLYEIYRDRGETTKQEKYKQWIISRYPDSEQARILSDPQYLQKVLEQSRQAEYDYEKAYIALQSGHAAQVIGICDRYLHTDIPDDLKSRFFFLRAQAIGLLGDERKYKEALTIVSDSSTVPEISARAREIIDYLNQMKPELKEEELSAVARKIYSFDPDADQILLILVPGNQADLNRLKFDLLNFNTDFDPQKDLPVTGEEVYQDTALLTVHGIGPLNKAREYYKRLKNDTVFQNYLTSRDIEIFLCTDANFKVFQEDKNVETYRLFFKQNYLQPQIPEDSGANQKKSER